MNCQVKVYQAQERNAFTRAVPTALVIIPNNDPNATASYLNGPN